jgi:hypothetical protein
MDSITLRGDCARCAALCCVALAFDRGASFAFDKPAGVPCPHLTANAHCSIHAEREARGFGGCVRYDCLGAGQRVTQQYGRDPATFEAFRVARRVHELLELLSTAKRLPLTVEQSELREELLFALERTTLESFERAGLEQRARAFLQSLRARVRRLRVVVE